MKEDMPTIKNVLTAATFETFERMFYIFLEPIEQIEDCDVGAAVQFNGHLNGQLKIIFSRKLPAAMVKNLLSCEEHEVTEKQVEDCIKEAANVICGNFLTRLDNRKTFDLSLPVFYGGSAQMPAATSAQNSICRLHFDSEFGTLGVLMTLSDR